ncbi:uncharacterized protein [Drosophila kikkawai]|uniref:MICOS complex subunit MIC13 n=1 Tax=Drosophila kikkawai TaxID=30033 RepID=A0A6P4I8S3_DROKI|nr:uncharacterized protein LOC108076289 [Drosophila kikkawai]
MVLQKLVNVIAFTSAFYLSQQLGFLYDPVEIESKKSPPVETEKNNDNSFFNEEDKRRLKRAKEDLEKKICTKNGLCEPPPPKPITESVSEAIYDTWLAVKKIPSCWSRAYDNICDTISRMFGGD